MKSNKKKILVIAFGLSTAAFGIALGYTIRVKQECKTAQGSIVLDKDGLFLALKDNDSLNKLKKMKTVMFNVTQNNQLI